MGWFSKDGEARAETVGRRRFLRSGGAVAAGAAAMAAANVAGASPAGAVSVNVPVYVPLAHAVRSYDSRLHGPPLSPGGSLVLPFSGLSDQGIIGTTWNVTVTQTQGSGFLAVFPGDIAWPGTSNINWSLANLDLANNAFVRIPDGTTGAGGSAGHKDEIIVLCGGSGPTHFILDAVAVSVVGNFVASSLSDAIGDALQNPAVRPG